MSTLFQEAETVLKNGLFQEAESLYTLLTIAVPHEATSWIGLGMSRFFMKNLDGALQSFDIASKLHPTHGGPLLWKIECLLQQGLKKEAQSIFSSIDTKMLKSDSEVTHYKQVEHIVSRSLSL